MSDVEIFARAFYGFIQSVQNIIECYRAVEQSIHDYPPETENTLLPYEREEVAQTVSALDDAWDLLKQRRRELLASAYAKTYTERFVFFDRHVDFIYKYFGEPDGQRCWPWPVLSSIGEPQMLERLEWLTARQSEIQGVADAQGKRDRKVGQAPAPSMDHAGDYTSVCWNGNAYHFNQAQATAVQILWEAWEKGGLSVPQRKIGARLGTSNASYRLYFTFRQGDGGMHPAWGTMIVPASVRGSFMLGERKLKNHESRYRTRTPARRKSGDGRRRRSSRLV